VGLGVQGYIRAGPWPFLEATLRIPHNKIPGGQSCIAASLMG
jgi:hypothetical protein